MEKSMIYFSSLTYWTHNNILCKGGGAGYELHILFCFLKGGSKGD